MSRRDSSRLEQSSISFEQCEEEEKRHYDKEEERLWKRQDMSAFKEAWQEAMYGEEEFGEYGKRGEKAQRGILYRRLSSMAMHESRTAAAGVGLGSLEQGLQEVDGILAEGAGHSRESQAMAWTELARPGAMQVLCEG